MGRRGLTRNDFVDAGLAFIDAHGATEFTARRLGEIMGIDPTAVYRHFPSLADVASAILDRLFIEVVNTPAVGPTPRARLEHRIRTIHRAFYQHPNLVPLLASSSGDSSHAIQVTREGVALLSELGLRGEQLIVAHQMIESYVVGSHIFDLGGSPNHLSMRRARRRSIDNPVFDQHSPDDAAVERINQAAFEMGIKALLDSIEAIAAQSATGD